MYVIMTMSSEDTYTCIIYFNYWTFQKNISLISDLVFIIYNVVYALKGLSIMSNVTTKMF